MFNTYEILPGELDHSKRRYKLVEGMYISTNTTGTSTKVALNQSVSMKDSNGMVPITSTLMTELKEEYIDLLWKAVVEPRLQDLLS